MARVNFKFKKDFIHGNKAVDKKGSSRLVTRKFAEWAKENGFGDFEEKEDKKAKDRETK